ncbi:hypothetical protein ASF61_12385 [Duganella sp. Leaf126]|uniref:DUF6624 domain-containing protein n=1 Tax=Duganella sp. Leaf126 TaxID=1736266 RepID=UPI0006F3ACD0|nr:DUF6624 domain-containing protein [Duganella sp. Leaf126]KQQ33832.1 hypothetical protein ASF61_12385 [Duganella sp. Leaf126]
MNALKITILAPALAAALLSLAGAAHAQAVANAEDTPAPAPTIEPVAFSGKIVSATGTLPDQLAVFAECGDGGAPIAGTVDADSYRVALPPAVACTVSLEQLDWAADVQQVDDAGTAVPQTMLVYPRDVPEPAIARELIAMGAADRALRQAWAAGRRDAAFQKKAVAGDRQRQRRLRQIITTRGWPTISMVGAEAANEAWRIAQHAPAAQRKHWVVFMRAAAAKHEIRLSNLATSLDRVRMDEKRPQIYGTQYSTRKDGAIQFYPIEDIAHIDERRLAMGLSTFARLQAQLAQPPSAPNQATPPTGP